MNSIRTLKKILWATIATVAIAAPLSAQTDPGQVAFSLEREGKLTEAEAAWSALAKQFPTRAEPLAHLGLIESKQEHYAEAIKYYKHAMALNPQRLVYFSDSNKIGVTETSI